MKKNIKSILVICISLLIIISFASCGNGGESKGKESKKASNISIAKLEAALKKGDSSLSLTESAENDGFIYTNKTDRDYTIKADKDKNVTYVKIEYSVNSIDDLKDPEKLKTITNKSSSKITRADLEVLNCVLQAGYLREALGESSLTEQDTLDFFSKKTNWKIGDWTIKVDYSSNIAIITAQFA